VIERLALEGLVAIGHLDAHALARGERDHLVGGKAPLGEDGEHFTAHIAGGANDGDLETHGILRKLLAIGRIRPAARPLLGEKP